MPNASLNEQDRRNVTASLTFDIPREDEAAIQAVLVAAGEALTRKVERQQENAAVTETKIGFSVELTPAATIAPRKTTKLGLASSDVSNTLAQLNAALKEEQGRVISTNVGLATSGQVRRLVG